MLGKKAAQVAEGNTLMLRFSEICVANDVFTEATKPSVNRSKLEEMAKSLLRTYSK